MGGDNSFIIAASLADSLTVVRSEIQGGEKVTNFIIFGIGNYLSDIIDIIHAVGGKVQKIFQNMPEIVPERTISLKERLSYLPYDVTVYPSLDAFEPEKGYEYALGCTVVQKFGLIEQVKKRHMIHFQPLLHPKAHIGSHVTVGEGVLAAPHATIAPNVTLADFSLVNRTASIGHDAHIGRYTRIGPAVTIASYCRIGQATSINIGATILDRVYIGNNSVIGAGALVTKDVPDNVVVFGVPAKIVRENKP
jgi:sugar O-acyltransferase (sialic acid O-acetyltransferase NeuD family)